MGLSIALFFEEHQVLVGVDEGKREHVVPREAAGKHDSRPFEAIEALLRGEVRLPLDLRAIRLWCLSAYSLASASSKNANCPLVAVSATWRIVAFDSRMEPPSRSARFSLS